MRRMTREGRRSHRAPAAQVAYAVDYGVGGSSLASRTLARHETILDMWLEMDGELFAVLGRLGVGWREMDGRYIDDVAAMASAPSCAMCYTRSGNNNNVNSVREGRAKPAARASFQ